MYRREFLGGIALFGLAACAGTPSARIGPDGLPLPQIYRIEPGDKADIQFRMLDSVNALRAASGAPTVQLSAELNASAETHSRDMALQNRPWLFGSDGSSPLDRARRVGFAGRVVGENISETYETELETLAAWMNQENTRAVILDKDARWMGFAWFQEPAGKLWWTLTMGSDQAAQQPAPNATATFDNSAFQLGTL